MEGVLHDVGMWLKFFEDGNFTHGCGRHSLVLVFQFDFFKSHDFFGVAITSPINDSICSLAD